MRLTTRPENLLERLVLALAVPPTPLMDTMVALRLARTVMTATEIGVFDALAEWPLSAEGVAERCRTNARATEKLLIALTGARYLLTSSPTEVQL